MSKIHDVIIVGAGPSGSLSAHLLAKSGLDVLVIERQKHLKRKVCGEYLCPLGVDLLKNLGLNGLLSNFNDVKGMNIFSPKEVMLNSFFPKINEKENWGKSLNREIFDNSLVDVALKSGAIFELESMVINCTNNASYWTIEVHDKSGHVKFFKSRLLIAADGVSSIVAKKLDITTTKKIEDRVAIHFWLDKKTYFENKGQMHLFADGSYMGIDPTDENEMNISLVCMKSKLKEFKSTHALLNYYIADSKILSQQIGYIDESIKVYVVATLNHETKDYHYPNLALVGDAAGFIDPLTGEGIFNALWTASALCREIRKDGFKLTNTSALVSYKRSKKIFFKQKRILNYFFQWLIRQNRLVELIAGFLTKKKKRADSFVGIIGNVYKPIQGIIKILI